MHINVSKYLILLLTCSRHSIFIIQDTYIYLPAFVDVDTISDHLTSFLLPLVVFNSVVIYFFFFFFFFFFSIGWRLFFQILGRGSCVETFFPAFLRSASTAHSLWTIISSDLCETVILHSFHMGIPLSPSIICPFNYVLNSA